MSDEEYRRRFAAVFGRNFATGLMWRLQEEFERHMTPFPEPEDLAEEVGEWLAGKFMQERES